MLTGLHRGLDLDLLERVDLLEQLVLRFDRRAGLVASYGRRVRDARVLFSHES
jgi:hypothetical protein